MSQKNVSNIDLTAAQANGRHGQNTDKNTEGLKPPWPKGVSGNPGGRPKKKPLTEALEKVYSDPKECMAAARALAKKARAGSIAHFQEAANRLEGRISDTDEPHGNVTFNVVISAPRPHKPDDGNRLHD